MGKFPALGKTVLKKRHEFSILEKVLFFKAVKEENLKQILALFANLNNGYFELPDQNLLTMSEKIIQILNKEAT